ncbi:MAG: hypothetical protein QM778_14420 [Myxococcales bacterium]
MSNSAPVRAWLLLTALMVLGLAPWMRARAQSGSALGLYVDPAVLSPEALRVSLEAELGFGFTSLAQPAPDQPMLRVEALGADGVRIVLEGGDGLRVERDAPLLDHDLEGIETVTFLASNMLRNEAAGLLSELDLAPRDTEKPPPVRLASAEPEPLARDPLTVFNACLPRATIPVGIDFLPYVGFSSAPGGRRAVRALSFGAFGSYSRGVRGLSISGLVNMQQEFMCGVQVGGAVNAVYGSQQGVLVSLVNVVGRSSGGVLAGLVNVVRGAQAGATVGLVNLVFHNRSGASAGLLNFNVGTFTGYSGGLLNFATSDVSGFQGGMGNISGGNLKGVQASLGNVALGSMHGVQIGLGNIVGKEAHGLQLGLFNYAEKNRAPIGIVSIVKNGRTDLDLWGPSESGSILVGAMHGGELVHNFYYVGVRTGSAGQRFVTALGIGVRAVEYRFFRLDVDAISEYIYRDGAREPTFQQGIRVPFTFIVTPGLGLMVAPSYQFYFSSDSQERSQAPFGRVVLSHDNPRIEAFPGLAAGLRFELPSRSARAE